MLEEGQIVRRAQMADDLRAVVDNIGNYFTHGCGFDIAVTLRGLSYVDQKKIGWKVVIAEGRENGHLRSKTAGAPALINIDGAPHHNIAIGKLYAVRIPFRNSQDATPDDRC